ncbi:calcium/sodium antiporter [Oricola cellulosilytica]|uniref:Calcium/sodium antiporter n=1 Tax=Oricola cellulosilytica TaxID=1429082 RepID=A0A4R0PFQ7_9HYPH|nr:calcium/sodium antiporter [Oricola cellulosilytica]TCD14324.1 calcium/sodium antiporter [Oricola cellulosilytica]
MFLDISMLIAGLVLLVFAGDYLVKGAAGLAENLGIPPLVIGLTVVAFGTSAPELFVSLQSALSGAPDIAVGNVVGSNIANILLVMGAPALIAAIHANQRGLSRNTAVMIAFTLAFMWMLSDGTLQRIEATGLFAGLLLFIIAQILRARVAMEDVVSSDYHDELGEMPHSSGKIAVFLAGGLIGLPLAAHLTVAGASGLAEKFGVSQAAIGLTIVAIGTSLPELATTMMAAWRKEADVALGNIIGSNIFNIAAIMGITGMIIPIPVSEVILQRDIWVMLVTSLLLAIICFARITTGRVLGAVMFIGYLGYIVSIF